MDDLIQELQVTTQTRFDRSGKVSEIRQYTYFVGDHGPFTDEFSEGKDTPDAVRAAQQARIDHLRAVGAINSSY